ncbi:MAG: hypothetical protein ACR2JW_20835 [Thermomicrobiales bacterium]
MIRTVRRLGGGIVVLTLLVTLFVSPVMAATPSYSLFGDATYVMPGNASLRAVQATSTGPNAFGGVDFTLPIPTVTTLATLNNLMTDYKITAGDCGLGSPRFSVEVTTPTGPKNVFFYIGPPPNYTNCPKNVWVNSGNLAAPANLVDTSQLPGGTFYEPYAAAQAVYGSYPITDIALVVDGTGQTVQFDNTKINATTYTYEPTQQESVNSCKKDGYEQYTGQNGLPGPFKNQGQCVSYFNHQD